MIASLIQRAKQAEAAGNVQQAWQLYQQVLQQQPQHSIALGNTGLIAMRTGHIDQAIQLLTQAIAADSKYSDWHAALALSYQRDGQPEHAIASLQRALQMQPDDAQYHCRMADLLTETGALDESIAHYLIALEDSYFQAEALYGLATLAATGDYQFTAQQHQQLDQILQQIQSDHPLASRLFFAKAQLLHKAKEYDQAFVSFQRANELKKQNTLPATRFDAELETSKLHMLDAAFSASMIHDRQQFGSDSDYPVFVVGMPRTGSTLLAAMLGCHPQIIALSELPHLRNIIRSGLPNRLGQPFPQCITAVTTEVLAEMAQWYLQQIRCNETSALRSIDKMPINYELLGLVYLLFPNARVIHTVRDPLDTLWSCYRQDINMPFSNDFTDMLVFYRLYQRYMDLWKQRLPLRILDVRYENLVDDSESECRKIIDFLGLEWNDNCLTGDRKNVLLATASRTQARKPVYRSAMQGWKHYQQQLQGLRSQLDDDYPA